MKITAPRFWFANRIHVFAFMLWPLTWVYYVLWLINRRLQRSRRPAHSLPRPIVCVGNSVVGGAGKTPVVSYLAKLLARQNYHVGLISRGYGGKIQNSTQVKPTVHVASDVGDEPLLLATLGDTWVGRDRNASCREAVRAGADVVVLDDGLQNESVPKDLSLLVVDGYQGFGNGLILPAGPLREPLLASIQKIDAAIIMGDDMRRAREITEHIQKFAHCEFPIFKGALHPVAASLEKIKSGPLYAFAGIGYPAKFFHLLRKHGADVVRTEAFPDHYAYTMADLEQILAAAKKHGAMPITTLKDWVRLPKIVQEQVAYFEVEFQPNDPSFFNRFVMGKIETLMAA